MSTFWETDFSFRSNLRSGHFSLAWHQISKLKSVSLLLGTIFQQKNNVTQDHQGATDDLCSNTYLLSSYVHTNDWFRGKNRITNKDHRAKFFTIFTWFSSTNCFADVKRHGCHYFDPKLCEKRWDFSSCAQSEFLMDNYLLLSWFLTWDK